MRRENAVSIMRSITICWSVILVGVVKCELTVHELFETAKSRPSASFAEQTDGSGSQRRSPRFKYREFAETEFHRPGYLPIPYVVGGLQGGDLRTMPIPSVDLSEIIRQHISHQRDKWMKSNETRQNLIPSTILDGVTHIIEFRQTPFRRFPDSPPEHTITYEEKRRRWKSELVRRLRGPKVPAREIAAGGQLDTTTTVAAGDYDASVSGIGDRYYVTYSPETRVYQVSRRPPSNLEPVVEQAVETTTTTTTQEPSTTLTPIILPTDVSSAEESDQLYEVVNKAPKIDEPPTTPIEATESEDEMTTAKVVAETTEPPTFVRLEDDEENSDEWGLPAARVTPLEVETARDYLIVPSTVSSTTTSTSTTTTTTTEEPTTTSTTTTTMTITTTSPTVIIQEAETIPRNLTFFQQIRVTPERLAVVVEQEFPTVKQILHLDDYYQEMDDEDDTPSSPDVGDSPTESTVSTPSSSIVATSTASVKSLFYVSDSDEEEESPPETENPMIVPPTDRSMDHDGSYSGTEAPIQLATAPTTTSFSRGYEVERLPTVRTNVETAELSENVDEDDDEDDDDDDLFFWRPEQSSQNRQNRQSTRYRDLPLNSDEQPFEIVAHRDLKRRI